MGPQGSNRLAGPSSLEPPSPPRPISGRWLVPEPPPGRDRPMRNPALRGSQFRAPSPPAAAPQAWRRFKTSLKKTGGSKARSSAAPGADPGMISPSETQSSIYTAKLSSHTESRGQVVSLSSGSCYSISAIMLAPRVF